MKVLVIAPEKEPVLCDIDGSLKSMQAIVDGYIQAYYPWIDEVAIVCNDEGKINGLPLNRSLMITVCCWMSSPERFSSAAHRWTVAHLPICQRI